MADEVKKATDPLASGGSTTEGKLAILGVVVGLVMIALGALLPYLQAAQKANPGNTWLPIATMVCGAAVSMGIFYGFNKGRVLFKNQALQQLLATGIPVVVGAVANRFLKSQGLGPVPPEQLPSTPALLAGTTDPSTAPTPALGTRTVYPPSPK